MSTGTGNQGLTVVDTQCGVAPGPVFTQKLHTASQPARVLSVVPEHAARLVGRDGPLTESECTGWSAQEFDSPGAHGNAPTTAGGNTVQPGQPTGFVDPTPAGAIRPRIAELDGRLVIVVPLSIARGIPNALDPGKTQDRITADVFVLDGPPFAYGGRPEEGLPHTLQTTVPARFAGMYISQVGLVASLVDAIGKGVVLGRIQRGQPSAPGRRPPWQLVKLAPDDPARQMAQQLYSGMLAGTWTPPTPIRIAGAPAPSMAASGTYATTMPHTADGVAIPQGGVALPPGSPAWQPAAVPPAPAGYEAVWATMSPEVRQAVLAAQAPSAAAAPAPAQLVAPANFEAIWPTLDDNAKRQIIAAQTPTPNIAAGTNGNADPRF